MRTRFSSAMVPAGLLLATTLFSAGCFLLPPAQKEANTPKYNEWKSYEGNNFEPKIAPVKAVDPAAGTITLADKDGTVLHITAQTRILHNTTDVPLAQVPATGSIKYTLSSDGQQVLSVWFGSQGNIQRRGKQKRQVTTYF